MRYVTVPRQIKSGDLEAEHYCCSPSRYSRFVPAADGRATTFLPLDKLILLREETARIVRSDWYRYAEIGDIDTNTGGVRFRKMRGYQLPTDRLSVAKFGDILISTVRTYRRGIGLVVDRDDNLVTTNAVLNIGGLGSEVPNLTTAYIYAFLRSDFFIEQVWSLLNRGVYPRLDTTALHSILVPVAQDDAVIDYVGKLALAIADKECDIRTRIGQIHSLFHNELIKSSGSEFRYSYPTAEQICESARMDAGFWSKDLRAKLHFLSSYEGGCWPSLYDAGFKTRRGPNLAVSVAGIGHYYDDPTGSALPLATPGDITDYMTVRRFRYYGNSRRVDTVRPGEVLFAAKGMREVSIGHTYVNSGLDEFVTNFDSFLIDSGVVARNILLAAYLNYCKHIGIFARLSDTSNGGSFVERYFYFLPIPKLHDGTIESVAALYSSSSATPSEKLTLDDFVAWHRRWNAKLGIWELDREMKSLQKMLMDVQEQIIQGKTVDVPTYS